MKSRVATRHFSRLALSTNGGRTSAVKSFRFLPLPRASRTNTDQQPSCARRHDRRWRLRRAPFVRGVDTSDRHEQGGGGGLVPDGRAHRRRRPRNRGIHGVRRRTVWSHVTRRPPPGRRRVSKYVSHTHGRSCTLCPWHGFKIEISSLRSNKSRRPWFVNASDSRKPKPTVSSPPSWHLTAVVQGPSVLWRGPRVNNVTLHYSVCLFTFRRFSHWARRTTGKSGSDYKSNGLQN